MKKLITLLLVLAMALAMTACSSSDATDPSTQPEAQETVGSQDPVQETQGAEASESTEGSEAPQTSQDPGYTFCYKGVEIVMNVNAAQTLALLGEPKTYTEETSCAFEGLDKTYYYGSFYLQTYPQGDQDYIYCVWLVDDGVSTNEGIYIGATQAEVESVYGTECFNGSNAYILTQGSSRLTIILTNGTVSSIQYDAVVE